jgi:hypothetical protein
MTVRQMMFAVALLAPVLALHTPVLRDVMRHERRMRDSGFRSRPATVARENYIYSLNTVPGLMALAVLDTLILIVLLCWRRRRGTVLPRSSMSVGDSHTRARDHGDSPEH